jgi:hypothetical protein
MSDSAISAVAAAIRGLALALALASVVAAVGLALSRRQHRESLLFDCLAQAPWDPWRIGSELGGNDSLLNGCRDLMREVTK